MSNSPRKMNPFPGLRPFTQEEDYLFFGREEQTLELFTRLGSNRFVAVVGTSGSGKSSLVRCGLLSELLGGKMLGAGAAWEIAVTHPGGNPLALLTEALLDADLYDREQENIRENLLATLSRSHFGLVEAVKQAGLGDDTNFLLVVDQFEEIFRFQEAGQKQQEVANDFVSLLLEAAAQKEVPIYVVLTMRSDFIGECGQFEGLAEMVNRGEFLIPRLTREQYKRVIEGPIKVAGGQIAPRLLQRLLNDLGQQADQLPCLQHALMRTWNVWAEKGDPRPACEPASLPQPARQARLAAEGWQARRGALDLDDYQRVGKMTQALSLHADEIYDTLPTDRQRQLCRGLFQALTVQESENRGVRRPQRLGALCQILNVAVDDLLPIIDAYRQHGVTFLMPSPEVELTDRTIIDISHESLMRVWTRLRHWVEEEAQAAGIYQRLSESAALYRQGKMGLYRDPELGIALAWQESQQPNAAWAERYHVGFEATMSYLAASQQASVAEEQAKEAARQRELEQARQLAEAQQLRLEQQRRAARKLRRMIAGLAVVAVIAGLACVAALIANGRANTLADIARKNEDRALKNEEEAKLHALRAGESEKKTANALATVAAQKAEVEDSLSGSLEYFSAALKQADSYEARKPIFTLLARFDMVLAAFVERQPDDQQLQLALARRLAERGEKFLAKKQPATAQAELEKANAIFKRLHSNGNWQVLPPSEMKSQVGAKMELQKDGSVFVQQNATGKTDIYTLVFKTDLQGITGLRLEVLTDSRLPNGGPGWMKAGAVGNFYLSELTLEAAAADSSDKPKPIPLRNPWADVGQPPYDIRAAIDGNIYTAWSVWPEINKDHTAVFELAEKVGDGAATRLTVRLTHQTTVDGNLGRFRLSFTNDAKSLETPQILQDLKDSELVDCNIALGKAFAQQDRKQEAIASFTDALVRAKDRAGKAKVVTEAAPFPGVLEKLTEVAGGDGQFQAELAQLFVAQGQAASANAARAKARTWFEAKLAKEPENTAWGAELTQVLLDQQDQANPRWTVLKPSEMKSEGGTMLTLQSDGSILASGPNPDRDVYSLVARTDLKHIAAIRLEVLPDSSLPMNGPGRFPGNGNFFLNKIRVFSAGTAIPLTRIVVASPENADLQLQTLISGANNPYVGWNNFNNNNMTRVGQANSAVIATNLERATDDALKIELTCSGQYWLHNNLGRFRLSVSSDPAALDVERQGWKVTDPWLKLAAAYAANGLNEEALRYFTTTLKRANGYEARRPIIEVAARYDEILAELSKGQPDDPLLQLALARNLAERGRKRLAEKQPAQAQADLEKARTLVKRLVANEPQWTVLKPTDIKSKGGATLKLLEDGSILASGKNPVKDEYTLIARPDLENITAIRLEALPDPSLPQNGPGRAQGVFALSKLRVFSGDRSCPLMKIIVEPPNMNGYPVQTVIDGTAVGNSVGWFNTSAIGQPSTAIIATRVARGPTDDLKIEMDFATAPGWQLQSLGRFRLAVTSAADAINSIDIRKDLKDSDVTDLSVALAKAHGQQGHTDEAVALFTEAIQVTADRTGKVRILAEAAPLEGVLEKLIERVADDASLQAELARQLDARGYAPLAAAVRTKARALFERQLEAKPDSAALAAATGLAQLLSDQHESENPNRWTVLKPTEMKSAGGATLTLQPDGSILASGTNPNRDDYTLVARPALKQISAIRLEALLDPSLPNDGPGRDPRIGNFQLNRLQVFSGGQPATPTKFVDSDDRSDLIPIHDVNASTVNWTVGNRPGGGKAITIVIATQLQRAPDDDLKIELNFGGAPQYNLGRFRLWVSEDPVAFNREQRRFAEMKLTDPWARLAAAYRLVGDQQAFNSVLKNHPVAAVHIGDMYAAAQDWERAIAEYRNAITDQPSEAVLAVKLAGAYQSAGRTREGIPYLVKVSAATPTDTLLSMKVAALQAWFGEDKDYDATRQRILASAKGTNNVATAERTAKTCSICPSTDKAELEEAVALARKAAKVANNVDWNQLALGMAEYRSGNDAAAVEALLAAAKFGANKPGVTGPAAFYRAMSLLRLGKEDQARKLVIATAAKMKPLPKDENNPLAGSASVEDLLTWLAYKEARTLLKIDLSQIELLEQTREDEAKTLVADHPTTLATTQLLVEAYLNGGHTRDAVPRLATLSAANPNDTLLCMKVAALQAWFAQEKELAATRVRLLASAKDTKNMYTADRVAKACSLSPYSDKVELEAALTLARTAVELGKGGDFNLLALGMAEYRSGNDAAATEALLAAAKAGPNNPYVTGTSAFYQAMILFRQGKKDEASKLAVAAVAKMKPLPKDDNNPLAGGASHDDLILWLAYKEAQAMIQFDVAPSPKAENDKK